VLRNFGSRNDDLSAGDVVVRIEDAFQELVNSGVIVDLVSDCVGELDDSLGSQIAWSSLSSDQTRSWEPDLFSFLPGGLQDADVSVDDVQDVQ
jgi:hypothetical protein